MREKPREFPEAASIGGGNLPQSIAAGLLLGGYPANRITISNPSLEKLAELKAQGVSITKSNTEAAARARIIFPMVKPLKMPDVLRELALIVQENAPLVVSGAAGVPFEIYEEILGEDAKITRVMPSITARFGMSMTAISHNRNVTQSDRALIEDVFSQVGKITVLPDANDELLDVYTALYGCAPGFVAFLMKPVEAFCMNNRLSEEKTRQVMAGLFNAAALLPEGELLGDAQEGVIVPKELENALEGANIPDQFRQYVPSFMALLIKPLENLCMKHGLPETQARLATIQLLKGTALLAKERSLAAILKGVATPNGATAQGVTFMQSKKVDEGIASALDRVILGATAAGRSMIEEMFGSITEGICAAISRAAELRGQIIRDLAEKELTNALGPREATLVGPFGVGESVKSSQPPMRSNLLAARGFHTAGLSGARHPSMVPQSSANFFTPVKPGAERLVQPALQGVFRALKRL